MVKERPFSFKYNETKLFFGVGTLREKLFEVLEKYGSKNVLILTSRNAARVSGALNDVLEILKKVGVEFVIFDGVRSNPYASIADEASRIVSENNVDTIIAIGGGSVIDVAKVASISAVTGVKAAEIISNPPPPSKKAPPHLIVVNLTHGTGSEIDRWAVLTIDGTFEKRGAAVRYPSVSFDDPLYLKTLDKDQTMYTAFDAFYHAYESATSSLTHQLTITLSKEAIEIIKSTLPIALKDLSNVEYRTKLLYASMIAGICIDQSITHLNHVLEHPFSGLHPEIPHGAGLAILGPMVVYYTHKAVPEISAYILKPLDPSIKPVSEDAEKAYKAVKEFQESVGFNKRLRDYNVTLSDVEKAVEYAMKVINTSQRPIPFTPTIDILKDIVFKSF